jgi:hypothetical protein
MYPFLVTNMWQGGDTPSIQMDIRIGHLELLKKRGAPFRNWRALVN